MAMIKDGKVYRNLTEQVFANTQDIEELKKQYGFKGPYASIDVIPSSDVVDGAMYLIGTTSPYDLMKYNAATTLFEYIGVFPQTGPQGEAGNGISRIAKTGTSDYGDTYTIYYTNGGTFVYFVPRGPEGAKGDPGAQGSPGRGIVQIIKTQSVGLTDVYTIQYTDGTSSSFSIENGKDGADGPVQGIYLNGHVYTDVDGSGRLVNLPTLVEGGAYMAEHAGEVKYVSIYNAQYAIDLYASTGYTSGETAFSISDFTGGTYNNFRALVGPTRIATGYFAGSNKSRNASLIANLNEPPKVYLFEETETEAWNQRRAELSATHLLYKSASSKPAIEILFPEAPNGASYLTYQRHWAFTEDFEANPTTAQDAPLLNTIKLLGVNYRLPSGSATYTAGSGIDITNGVISVDNTIALKSEIPTKVSDLTNDSGYLTSVSWNDILNKPTIPTKTSDLTNDSGFITGITSAMIATALGYTPEHKLSADNEGTYIADLNASETALTQFKSRLDGTEYGGGNAKLLTSDAIQFLINQAIASVSTISFQVVQTLPVSDIQTNIIYLVPKNPTEQDNLYNEWIYVNNNWELIGSTEVDLSNYYTKNEVDGMIPTTASSTSVVTPTTSAFVTGTSTTNSAFVTSTTKTTETLTFTYSDNTTANITIVTSVTDNTSNAITSVTDATSNAMTGATVATTTTLS